jgi:hypothetical protein
LIVTFLFKYSEEEKKNFLDSLDPDALKQFLEEKEIASSIERSTRHKKTLDPYKIESKYVYSVYNLIK